MNDRLQDDARFEQHLRVVLADLAPDVAPGVAARRGDRRARATSGPVLGPWRRGDARRDRPRGRGGDRGRRDRARRRPAADRARSRSCEWRPAHRRCPSPSLGRGFADLRRRDPRRIDGDEAADRRRRERDAGAPPRLRHRDVLVVVQRRPDHVRDGAPGRRARRRVAAVRDLLGATGVVLDRPAGREPDRAGRSRRRARRCSPGMPSPTPALAAIRAERRRST